MAVPLPLGVGLGGGGGAVVRDWTESEKRIDKNLERFIVKRLLVFACFVYGFSKYYFEKILPEENWPCNMFKIRGL